MKIWIDFSNSPHPLLFAPVVRRLEDLGHEVLLTARDNAQTVALAEERWPHVEVIGSESPRGRGAKARMMASRIQQLVKWGRARRPDLALSHNSYGQILAARVIGLPVITAMDFEHQPANHIGFRFAQRILIPGCLPAESIRRQGGAEAKLVRYPGLKEELYVGDFEPDAGVFDSLGVERASARVLVVARTPPSRAAYHEFGNPLFVEALRVATAQPAVLTVVLTRHSEQREQLMHLGLSRCIIPEAPVDSRSLMHAADVVLGAGGTMTRESAILGIPTLSLFAGRQPAVDRWLASKDRLRMLTNADQLQDLQPRRTSPIPIRQLRANAAAIEDVFVDTVLGPRR